MQLFVFKLFNFPLMNFKKCLLPLVFVFKLVFVFNMLFCIAQTDSILKTDTINSKVSSFSINKINSRIDFSNHLYDHFDNGKYNHIRNICPNSYDPVFVLWPGLTFPDNYTQFNIRNNYYNYYNPSYSFNYPGTNPWVDPTNPWSTNKPEEALILGSINYIFSKLLQDR